MSSILKALKKVEDDKSTLKPDELKIDAEILRSDTSSGIPSTVVLILSFLLLAAGSGATYMYMKKDSVATEKQTTFKTTPAVISASNPEKQLPANTTSIESNKTTSIKTERVTSNVDIVPASEHKKNKVTIQMKPTQKPMQAVIKELQKSVEPVKETVVKHPTQMNTKTAPTLRVNGIAFQSNSADSMAIINGIPVGMGGVIDGATVEKIFNDKVIFKVNDDKFEIKLGQSNR